MNETTQAQKLKIIKKEIKKLEKRLKKDAEELEYMTLRLEGVLIDREGGDMAKKYYLGRTIVLSDEIYKFPKKYISLEDFENQTNVHIDIPYKLIEKHKRKMDGMDKSFSLEMIFIKKSYRNLFKKNGFPNYD